MIFFNCRNKDLAKVEKLCKHLNAFMKKETGIETGFICLKEDNDDRIMLYNEKFSRERDQPVNLIMNLYYPTRDDFRYSKEVIYT